MKKTLYQILEVEPTASAREIATAYDRLAAVAETDWPDPNTPGFLRQAKEILLDPLRRSSYDASLAGDTTRRSVDPHWKSDPVVAGGWGKWIAIALLIGAALWWAMRRAPPPAPAMPSPPLVVSQVSKPEPEAAVQALDPPLGSTEMKEAVPPIVAPPPPAGVPRSAENVFNEVAPSVARVYTKDAAGRNIGSGSAVVIGNGVVLTSCHVAMAGATLSVKLGETEMPAAIQLADQALDLCRLSVPQSRAPAVTIGTVGSLRTGQPVFAIGAPFGLELTISEGIVSALRKVEEGTVVQTTAPISPGSSGGGLFDLSGRLVGIVTFQHRYGQNLNFALPADWIAQMRARGASQGGWRSAALGDGSQDASSVRLIAGQWLCRDWISGRTGQYRFGLDGQLNVAISDSVTVALKYRITGRSLDLNDGTKGTVLSIEELTVRKMILRGTDRSLACERL